MRHARIVVTHYGGLQQKKIRPIIAQRFPLRRAAHAHELLGQGGVTGKLVLVCDGSSPEPAAI